MSGIEKLESRVDHLEVSVADLRNDIRQNHAAAQNHVDGKFDELRDMMEGKISSNKVNWQPISIIVGIFMAILASFGGYVLSNIAEQQNAFLDRYATDQGHFRKLQSQSAYDRGKNDQAVAYNTKAIVKLDEILQREMRLLDDTMKAKIAGIERNLSRTSDRVFNHHIESARALAAKKQDIGWLRNMRTSKN